MPTYKLIPYWFTLTKRQYPDEILELDNLLGAGTNFQNDDFVDVLDRFLSTYSYSGGGYEKLPDAEKTFSIRQHSVSKSNRLVEGIIATGRYGRGADHLNITDDTLEEGARGPDDAVVLPYYFMFHIPEDNRSRALLILEKFGNLGTKGPLNTVFRDWAREAGNVIPHYEPVITDDLFEEVQDSNKLVELTLTKTRTARSLHDQVGSIFKSEGSAKEKFVFANVSGDSLPLDLDRVKDAFFNSDASSVTIHEQEFNEGKLSTRVNGSTRSFALFQDEADMERIINPEQDNMDMNSDKHPLPTSISRIGREFANEMLEDYNEPTIPETSILD